MSALKEFLQSDAVRILAEAKAEQERYAEWDRSVEGLFAQVEGWIRDADPTGVIQLTRDEYHPFGPHNPTQKRLRITLGRRQAAVQAQSPFVLGNRTVEDSDPPVVFKPAGCAELAGPDDTYTLYLERSDDAERWYLRTGGDRVKAFARSVFERRLAGLLK